MANLQIKGSRGRFLTRMFHGVDKETKRTYFSSTLAMKNTLRESIAVKVGLINICGVGLNHHTLQSAVVLYSVVVIRP